MLNEKTRVVYVLTTGGTMLSSSRYEQVVDARPVVRACDKIILDVD